ncbi:MAG: hypothetical protein H7Y02_00150 [Candidatus Obscuribacterales bacterium]|nr:hypothetical protein [Steroidobacteraceae bacterium]
MRSFRNKNKTGRHTSGVQFEDEATERLLMLGGKSACRTQLRNARIKTLAEVEFRVFSQWGEDGIVEWLVEHIPVPNTRFVEFGVESFREANCRFLMMNRNWRGLVMDGNVENMQALRAQTLFWMYDLTAKQAFITAENINDLLIQSGFAGPLGILSIDIDGNDYWVWDKITAVDPAIVICEYNPILGDIHPIVVPYEAAFTRFNAHHSGLYFGASIAALKLLADKRGYEFVGTNSNGINAFFVRKDLAHAVLPLIETVCAFPSRHRDSRDVLGNLSFASGRDRLQLIQDMPVINVSTSERLCIRELVAPYSSQWLSSM